MRYQCSCRCCRCCCWCHHRWWQRCMRQHGTCRKKGLRQRPNVVCKTAGWWTLNDWHILLSIYFSHLPTLPVPPCGARVNIVFAKLRNICGECCCRRRRRHCRYRLVFTCRQSSNATASIQLIHLKYFLSRHFRLETLDCGYSTFLNSSQKIDKKMFDATENNEAKNEEERERCQVCVCVYACGTLSTLQQHRHYFWSGKLACDHTHAHRILAHPKWDRRHILRLFN